ncbi:MAG: serine/threonine-protein kinase [Verrucomicrobiota bacterium]|jgi:serine/threonine protein kinase
MDFARQRLEMLFDAALEIENPAERAAFLARECAGDAALQACAERLLVAHAQSQHFFDDCRPALPAAWPEIFKAETPPVAEEAGKSIGPYKLLQKIGEGGCGVVYMAEQAKPVRRRVALKIIKLGMDTKTVIARFEAERQALALMEHPNIARVLDAGATETGRPYFVMELVHGVRITEYCDQRQLDTRQRLDLFIQVCHAIQHAHQKGIIHRDIKPSNILVTLHDGVPMPKVIDFGIAKAIEEKLTDKTLFTVYGNFIGTPAYMSPEQAEYSGLDIDTRSDIYSLGVLLYELLTGKTPFAQNELLAAGLDEMRKTLREREPHRPSTRLDTFRPEELTATALRRHIEPPKLQLLLEGDLDWIVMKSLEKDRRRRYETANGLAMDVRRFLDNEPVLARPPSRWYRLEKLVRRNRGVFVSAGAVTLALMIGLVASTWLFLKERKSEQQQVRLRHVAESREKITHAALLVSQGRFDEADKLATSISFDQPSLESSAVLRSLGVWHALQGRWQQSADCFRQLQAVNQLDGWDILTLDYLGNAAVLAQQGDVKGYDNLRQEAITRCSSTGNPLVGERIIKASLLLPASQEVLNRLAVLARDARPGSVSGGRSQLPPGVVWRPDASGSDNSDTSATLPLPAESAGPGLAGACSFDGLSVGVEFTEPFNMASATARENYNVSGSSVTNVTPGADGKTVVLWLSSKLAGDFSVRIQNVKNSGGQPVADSSIGGTALNLQLHDLATGQPCSVWYQGGVAQVVAGGENIWEKADHFVYAFTKITGDFDYRLRVHSISSASEIYARTGLMARESFSEHGSREVMVGVNAENTFQVLIRSVTGGDAASQPPNPLPQAGGLNSWVRLQRLGSVFHCYAGTNGIDWNELYLFDSAAGTEGPFGDQINFGIATSSHTTNTTVTALVSDLGVNPDVNMMLPSALLEYRLGNYAKSEEWCHLCLSYPEYNASRTAAARVILAMDSQHEGQSDKARAELASATDSISRKFADGLNTGASAQGYWFDWIFARLLRDEAATQIH